MSDGGSHPGYYATRHISGESIGDATATLSADSVRDLRARLNSAEHAEQDSDTVNTDSAHARVGDAL